MGRDRFTKTEWGDWKNQGHRMPDFGFCDHGFRLQTREEAEIYKELKAQGHTVHKHGWPDFMATRGTEVRLIEVKSVNDTLKHSQVAVHEGLRRLGVHVDIISKDNPNRRTNRRGRHTRLV